MDGAAGWQSTELLQGSNGDEQAHVIVPLEIDAGVCRVQPPHTTTTTTTSHGARSITTTDSSSANRSDSSSTLADDAAAAAATVSDNGNDYHTRQPKREGGCSSGDGTGGIHSGNLQRRQRGGAAACGVTENGATPTGAYTKGMLDSEVVRSGLRLLQPVSLILLLGSVIGVSVELAKLADEEAHQSPWFVVLAPLKGLPGASATIYGNLRSFAILIPGSNAVTSFPLHKVSRHGEDVGQVVRDCVSVSLWLSVAYMCVALGYHGLVRAGVKVDAKDVKRRWTGAVFRALLGSGALGFGVFLCVEGMYRFPHTVGSDIKHNPSHSGLVKMLNVENVVVRWSKHTSAIDEPATTCIITAEGPSHTFMYLCIAWVCIGVLFLYASASAFRSSLPLLPSTATDVHNTTHTRTHAHTPPHTPPNAKTAKRRVSSSSSSSSSPPPSFKTTAAAPMTPISGGGVVGGVNGGRSGSVGHGTSGGSGGAHTIVNVP